MVDRDYAKKEAWEMTTKLVRYLCSQITWFLLAWRLRCTLASEEALCMQQQLFLIGLKNKVI
jgi:hypothetical protein